MARMEHLAGLAAAGLFLATGASAAPRRPAPVAAGHATEVARAADGLFYATVAVNGLPVRFLIDTGANVTMLTAADARRVGVAFAGQPGAALVTANGSVAMTWTRLRTVALAGRQLADVPVGVVGQGLPVSLIGQNVLARLGSVTIAGDRLRME